MSPDTLIGRALLAAALCLLGFATFAFVNRLARRNSAGKLAALGNLRRRGARPRRLLVYFTTPECIPCQTVQAPAIREVQAQLKDVEVIKIDATQKPELADQWGVVSVPTTFLVSARGQVRHINRGVARAQRLMEQLAQID